MRNLLAAALVTLIPLAALAAAAQTTVLDAQNMTCELCPVTATKSLEKKTATVTFDPDKTNAAALVKAATDAGYPSPVHK
jgi:mercuric ion binding protein